MMKLKRSLRNSGKRGLPIKVPLVLLLACILGCTSSTKPTYLKENIDQAVGDLAKKEYKIDVKAKLVGSTLWVYMPVEDMLAKSDKPIKYTERFSVDDNRAGFEGGGFKVAYAIKNVPEKKEKQQDYKYNKEIVDKISNVWKIMRRVLFSSERSKDKEPKFFCLVIADIKNGFEIKEVFYALDLKKVSYDFISWTEYQHRAIDETNVSADIIGDKEGLHLDYKDISLEEFLAMQIKHRIKLKFQKPEVDKNIDIDKEVLKIVVYTIKIYGLHDFKEVQLDNLVTENRVILNRMAVWARPTE